MNPVHQGHLAMLAYAGLVSGSFALGSRMANEIDPAAFTAVRFALAASVLWVGVVLTGGASRSAFAAPWRYVVLAGLFCFYFVSMFEGLKTALPVSMAAVFTLNPALTAVLSYLILRQITTLRMALAIVIGGAGALWVIFRGDLAMLLAFDVGRGEVIFFVGSIAHALYAPLVRKFSRGEPGMVFNACVLSAGAVMLALWAAPELIATQWSELPPIVWTTLAYTAFFSGVLSFTLVRFAVLRLPSAKVMAYTYLVPSFVVVWQLALGAPAPPGIVLPGVALTIAALLVLLKDEDQPTVAKAAS